MDVIHALLVDLAKPPQISVVSRYISGFAHNGQFLEGGEKTLTTNCVPYITQNSPTKYACCTATLKPPLHPQKGHFRSKIQHNGHVRPEGGRGLKFTHVP